MKFRSLPIAIFVALTSAAGLAQLAPNPAPPSQIDAADKPSRDDLMKMFEVMHIRKQMEQLTSMMSLQMKRQMHETVQKYSPGMSAEDEAKMEASAGDAVNIYPVAEMLDDIVPIYQRHMTKSDVDAIVAFYTSPAGQHLLEQSPAMMREAMATIGPKANERSQAAVEKMRKQIPPAPPPPAAPSK